MVRIFILFCLFLCFANQEASAQLPGDSCVPFAAGVTRLVNDSDNDLRDVILICNGATWSVMHFNYDRIQDSDDDTFIDVDTADDDVIRFSSVNQPVATMQATGADTNLNIISASNTATLGFVLTEPLGDHAFWGVDSTSGFLEFQSNLASEAIIFRNQGNEAARVHSNGFLGVNEPAPQEVVDVNGVFAMNPAIYTADGNGTSYLNTNAAGAFSFYVNSTRYARFDGGGAETIAIGVTGDDTNPSVIVIGEDTVYVDQVPNRVGLSNTSPQANLDVSDTIIVGTTNVACTANEAGAMRWNSTDRCMEVCNGAGWGCNTEVLCPDEVPDAYSFTDVTAGTNQTLYETSIQQITGLADCGITIAIEGEGGAEYRTCDDATCTTVLQDWTTAVSGFGNDQYVQLRMTSSPFGGVNFYANVRIANSAAPWNVQTAGTCLGASPTPNALCADGSIYIGTTVDNAATSYKLYAVPCRLPARFDGAGCNGTRGRYPWNNNTSSPSFDTAGADHVDDGQQNTLDMVGANPMVDGFAPYIAANYCNDLGSIGEPEALGRTDWYLPSQNEADLMCDIVGANGNNFDWNTIWTSTERSTTTAHYERSDCWTGLGSGSKWGDRNVMCVRREL